MNILNTIKKYFLNNNIKTNFIKTTNDNSFDKITLESLDFKLNEIESIVNGLINFTELQRFNIATPSWASNNTLSLFIIGRICVITGGIYMGNPLPVGNHIIDLPISVRPRKNQIINDSPHIASGITYNTRITLSRNNSKRIELYNYNEIPAQRTLGFTLIFDLDETPYFEQ